MSQEELRERWRKIREEKLAAEIRQQKEDREREANGSANDAEQQPPPQNVQPQVAQPQNQDSRPQ
jgi:heme-binding NEAT domain protein